MSIDAQKTDSQSEDIDLLLLIERSILFFRKFIWVFVVAIVLGLASGIFVYRSLPNIYRSRLIAHSFLLTNQEQIQIIENWNNFLGKEGYPELATTLNCRENILYSLKKIKGEEIQKEFSNDNPNGFFIEVNITDISILDELQKGIVYGLENNEYVKEKLAARRSDLKELIDKTGIEIKRLDSTKKIVENIIEGKSKSSSPLIIEGAGMNRQLIEMNEKLLSYREDLKFATAIQILQSFNKFRQPVGPKLIPWLVIGLVFFLALAYIYALSSSIREKLKKRSFSKNKASHSTV
jgi:hypothetical protein